MPLLARKIICMIKIWQRRQVVSVAKSAKESFYRANMQGAPADERARDVILAAANGELWKIQILHEELGVNLHSFENEALDVAAEQGHLETVKYLVGKGCPVNKGHAADGFTPYIQAYPFILALQAARWDVAAYLLEQGANPCANFNQPLLLAVEKNNLDFVRLLFETGKINPVRNSGSVLREAAAHASCETTRYLLAHMQPYEQEGLDNALLAATVRNFPEMIQLFLDAGANPNASCGASLYEGATKGYVESVRTLIHGGADAAISDFHAFRVAALHNKHDVVRLMLEEGCLHDTPEVFETLTSAGKYGHPMESAIVIREWRPALNEDQKKYFQEMYRDFLTRDFPDPAGQLDLKTPDGHGRSKLVALILAGDFEKRIVPDFKDVSVELLLQRDAYGINAIEALSRFGELDKLFSPGLWQGRGAELQRLWQEVPEHHRQDVDFEKTISVIQQHELREKAKKHPRLRLG